MTLPALRSEFRRAHLCAFVAFGVAILFASMAASQDTEAVDQQKAYTSDIRPLLERYCYECHAADTTEAEIDFAAFASVADVRRRTKVWQKVDEMLGSGQMPPKDAEQPTDAERVRLAKWVHDFLTAEAIAERR